MVANNFLGLSKRDWINLSFELSDSSKSFSCIGFKLKNATSDPEIKAENVNKITNRK
jgi:hypothetical protein